MTFWTFGELQFLRALTIHPATRMARLCEIFPTHPRDEIVEAIDCLRRCDTINEALARLKIILANQDAGIPLVNGKPQAEVCGYWGRGYAPMF